MSRFARAFLITALVSLLGAAVLHPLAVTLVSGMWPVFVHVMLFGWISGMIMAVNYHTLPVFSGRSFANVQPIWWHWGFFSSGLLAASLGIGLGWSWLEITGLALELCGSLLFLLVVIQLMRQPKRQAAAPMPPVLDQANVDKVGTNATKAAGVALPLVQFLLLAVRLNWIHPNWMLAAEHLSALGWIMLMIVGVGYHVLPRFSSRAIRGSGWAKAQLSLHLVALLMIVFGLGLGISKLFAAGAVSMTVALALFAYTIWPTLQVLRPRILAHSIKISPREIRP
jgi:hypothetical protein